MDKQIMRCTQIEVILEFPMMEEKNASIYYDCVFKCHFTSYFMFLNLLEKNKSASEIVFLVGPQSNQICEATTR